MINNLVSIIVPAYNTEKYISETIESVINQTYPNWELLITDDCSPDNLKAIVLSYANKDPRIKYFSTPSNSGPAVARNISLSNAKGRFIAFLDSDDVWLPNKLECQISFMLDNQIAFSYTAYQRMNVNGAKYNYINFVPRSLSYDQLLKNTAISTLTVILDKEKIPQIEMTPGWGYDDFVLWLSILKSGIIAYGLNDNLAYYRVMDKSVSSNKRRAIEWVWNIYRDHEKLNFISSLYFIFHFLVRALIKRIG